MKYFNLFENFSENEPAKIVNQLKEIEKQYRYYFEYDNKLKNKYVLDSTDITQKQAINYWLSFSFFEIENEEPIYYWKWYINITINNLISADAASQTEEIPTEEIPTEEIPTEEIPEEEELMEATDEDISDDEEEPKIEDCNIKLIKYDYETSKKIGNLEKDAKIVNLLDPEWLVKQIDIINKNILQIPSNQKDVDDVIKNSDFSNDVY